MLDTFNSGQRVALADTMNTSNFGLMPRTGLISRVWSQKRTVMVNTSNHYKEAEHQMTDSREAAVITEALTVIDKALAEMLHRELVSTGEVADLLLDVRLLLTASASTES
ncbi:MAG: hypothetical protein WC864_05770 [Ilumatobacteraceae bacterium]